MEVHLMGQPVNHKQEYVMIECWVDRMSMKNVLYESQTLV